MVKRGGRRILAVSPEILVAFCKFHDGRRRSYTVANALPDDARIVDGHIAWARGNMIEIILESVEWQDAAVDHLEYLPALQFQLHYLEVNDADPS